MLIRAGKDSQNSNVQTKIAKQNFSRPRGPPRATPHSRYFIMAKVAIF